MGSTIPLEAAASNLGIDISDESGRWAITFDLEQVERFKTAYGADVFLEVGCRYIEDRCNQLGLINDLWLWLEAVRANG
ncbi:MAG: hypothetical protein EOR33_28380 [Mesorhizobium sp.]|nr:MAG: hypothetical protein EOR33_28380 [Mesorhizobium sp.]